MLRIRALNDDVDEPWFECEEPTDELVELAGSIEDVPDYHPSYKEFALPLPPEVERFPPALGRVVWPCWGASRYAVGHVLVTAEVLAHIESSPVWYGEVVLEFDDGANQPVQVGMRLRGARPLADCDSVPSGDPVAGDGKPWLLTLVDQRFHRANNPVFSFASLTSWDWGYVVQNSISAVLGSDPSSEITQSAINTLLGAYSPAFPAPWYDWWLLGGVTVPGSPPVVRNSCTYTGMGAATAFVDAACAAVNLRLLVVPTDQDSWFAWSGGIRFELQSSDTAAAAFETWFASALPSLKSGGRINTLREAPDRLRAWFPGMDRSGSTYNWTEYATIVSSYSPESQGNLSVTLNPLANTTGVNGSGNYATRYGADVGRWFATPQAEAVFAGFLPFPGSSCIHEIIWDQQTGTTRITRAPLWYPWPLHGMGPPSVGTPFAAGSIPFYP